MVLASEMANAEMMEQLAELKEAAKLAKQEGEDSCPGVQREVGWQQGSNWISDNVNVVFLG